MPSSSPKSDLFVSYASEDAGLCTDSLTMALWEIGVRTLWIDRIAIQHGESIPERVDEGLRSTRYLLPIISPKYFKKPWTRRELDAVRMLEKPALPVWVQVDAAAVKSFSPMLASQKALIYDGDPYRIAEKIAERLELDKRTHYYRSRKVRAERKLFWQLAWVYVKYEIRGEDFPGFTERLVGIAPAEKERFVEEIRANIGLDTSEIQDRVAALQLAAEQLGNKLDDDDAAHLIVGYAKRMGTSFAYQPEENHALSLVGLTSWT